MSLRNLMLTISLGTGSLAIACTLSTDLTASPPGATQPSSETTTPPSDATQPPAEATTPATDSAPLGETFQIGLDQPTHIEGTDLTVTFQDVVEDSRCPEDVECFWAGRAVVRLNVAPGAQPVDVVELTTETGEDIATVGTDYVITLLAVSPYPQTVEKDIPLSDYTVSLTVSTSGAN